MKTFIILSVLFLHSCIIQFVTGNEYSLLSEKDKNRVVKLSKFENLSLEKIYETTGNQLKEEMNKHEKSIVYIFVNGCKSESCLPLNYIENFAKENNYHLFLVMNGYYHLEQTTAQNINNYLYSINADYYGETKSKKYTKEFKKELGYFEFSKNKYLGGYLFFENSKLIEIKSNLE